MWEGTDAPQLAMDGLRHLSRRVTTALCAVLAALVCAGGASALDDPSLRWPVDGPAVQTAMAIAQDYWGVAPCHGQVTLAWEDLDASVDAQTTWANDVGPFADATRNTDCELSYSTRGQWDWPKLCTITVHEVGHLTGHDHVADPQDVMYYTFMQPLPVCAATPEPAAPAPATGSPPATAAAPPAVPAAKARPARATAAATKRRRAAARRAARRRAARRTRAHRASPRSVSRAR